MPIMRAVLVVLCGVAIALAAPHKSKDAPIEAIPLQQQVLSVYVPTRDEQDEGINSYNISPPSPRTHMENVIWDPATMPHPDVHRRMPVGPDRTLIPNHGFDGSSNEAKHSHVNARNMVLDDDTFKSNPNIAQSEFTNILDSYGVPDTSDMPVSPEHLNGPDCSDEDEVMRTGSVPVFSATPALPVKRTKGANLPEVNSYKDFASGLPRGVYLSNGDITNIKVEKTDNSAKDINDLPPSPLPVNNTVVDMGFKFTGKLQFLCSDDYSGVFDSQYGRYLREALSVGAVVPVGNVAISDVTKETVVSIDVGAPTLTDVRDEVLSLRGYINSGGLLQRMQLSGLPTGCTVTIISLGDGLDDHGLMPEPTVLDQKAPPGGFDNEELSPLEIKEKLRVREVMTYGEYTQPGRYNVSKLAPHIFGKGVGQGNANHTKFCLPDHPECVAVVGRFKFQLEQSQWPLFANDKAVPMMKVLQSITGVPPDWILVIFDNKPAARLPSLSDRKPLTHWEGIFVQTQAEASASSDLSYAEDPALIVDFAIEQISVEGARETMTKVMSVISEPGIGGFKSQLLALSPSFPDVEFSLLFIEIEDSVGHPIEESCEEEEDAEDAEDDALVRPHPPVGHSNMNRLPNCTTPVIHIAPDNSTANVEPAPSKDDWAVMAGNPQADAHMNLPRLAEKQMREPMLVQRSSESKAPKPHVSHETALGLQALNQIDVALVEDHPHKVDMKTALLQQMAADSNSAIRSLSAASKEMPEADVSLDPPAGGFPVMDLDPGLSL